MCAHQERSLEGDDAIAAKRGERRACGPTERLPGRRGKHVARFRVRPRLPDLPGERLLVRAVVGPTPHGAAARIAAIAGNAVRAELASGISGVFVNLARRSQVLPSSARPAATMLMTM